MKRWITAPEIIEKGYLNEITLICAVWDGTVIAHDKQTLSDIDITKLESFFSEIVASVDDPTFWDDREEAICYTEDRKAPRKPWHILYEDLFWLKEEALSNIEINPIRIPERQFEEILAGWGTEQVKEIVFESVFNEDEIREKSKLPLSAVKEEQPRLEYCVDKSEGDVRPQRRLTQDELKARSKEQEELCKKLKTEKGVTNGQIALELQKRFPDITPGRIGRLLQPKPVVGNDAYRKRGKKFLEDGQKEQAA